MYGWQFNHVLKLAAGKFFDKTLNVIYHVQRDRDRVEMSDDVMHG